MSEDRLKVHVLNETHKEGLPSAEDVVKNLCSLIDVLLQKSGEVQNFITFCYE